MRRTRRTRWLCGAATIAAALLAGCDEGDRPATPASGGPLVITKGGTYTGACASDDPDVPAVTVRTSDAVVLDRLDLRGKGTLVAVRAAHANVTVRDCRGVGENPGVAGRAPGRFLSAEAFDRVAVEHCELTHTAGIYLLGSDATAGATVRILANRATDIDGRKSDGHGGWLSFNDRRSTHDGRAERGYAVVQFLQLDKVRRATAEIAWNEVVNAPGESRVEDNLNLYESGGTAEQPLRVHDNYVQGAYTIDPARRDQSPDADWTYSWDYSGGGLLLGDGPGETAAGASAFVRATDNVVVGTVNYGIAIAAGHDIAFDRNRIVSSGRLPDGRAAAGQNVGAYVWDANHGKRRGSFYADGGTGNVIGWVKGTGRNDAWTPDATTWAGTTHLPNPVTPADEAAAHAGWTDRARRAGIVIGPRP